MRGLRHGRWGIVAAAALVVAGGILPAAAQIPADVLSGRKLPPIDPIARPSYPNEIALYPKAKVSGADEQWERYIGGPIVRNVTRPTLIPFLPAPGKANGTAIIIVPGGGFRYLGMDETEARQLADRGVATFILKYRTVPTDRDPHTFLINLYKFLMEGMTGKTSLAATSKGVGATPEALEDGQAAMRIVRARAREWGIDPHRVGMFGGSAGAATAIDVGLSADAAVRPDFIGAEIGPKAIADVPAYAPPLFIAAAVDDPLFPATGETILSAWAKAHRPIEAHFYERGGHGLPKGTTAGDAFDAFCRWLQMHDLLPAVKPAG